MIGAPILHDFLQVVFFVIVVLPALILRSCEEFWRSEHLKFVHLNHVVVLLVDTCTLYSRDDKNAKKKNPSSLK